MIHTWTSINSPEDSDNTDGGYFKLDYVTNIGSSIVTFSALAVGMLIVAFLGLFRNVAKA